MLLAFGVSSAEALAGELADLRTGRFWADRSHAFELRTLAERFPALGDRARYRAEQARSHTFDVFGRTVHFSGPVSWRRDPVTGHRFESRDHHDESMAEEMLALPPVKEIPRGSDPKRVWVLGRMDWAVALGQGAWLDPSRAMAYERSFVEMCSSFLDDNPMHRGGVHWSSPMEVALRAANLATALHQFRGAPSMSGVFLLGTLRSLWEHARFVEARLEDDVAVPNNHLVANLVGLLHVALLFPELPGALGWRALAISGLREQIHEQVLSDGLGFEGSLSYHRLLLELLVRAHLLAQACGASLGEAFASTLQRMFLATRGYLGDRGLAPQLGDNDSGRALPITDRELDHGYLPSLGAALFADARLKAPGATFCDEAGWLLGEQGRLTFERLRETPSTESVAFSQFGLACLRQDEKSVAFSCGSTGQKGVGGHGHNDKLSVEICFDGRAVIVDPGTWTYGAHPEGRDYFRSTAMHNTVQVDDLEQSPIPSGRPFALPDVARAQFVRMLRPAGREVAVGVHRGYARLEMPVWHWREVSLESEADACLVIDELTGVGQHAFVSRFHLPCTLARMCTLGSEERARLETLPAKAKWAVECAVEIGPEGEPWAIWVGSSPGEVQLVESTYSAGYDQRTRACCIELKTNALLPTRLFAAVLRCRTLPPFATGSGRG